MIDYFNVEIDDLNLYSQFLFTSQHINRVNVHIQTAEAKNIFTNFCIINFIISTLILHFLTSYNLYYFTTKSIITTSTAHSVIIQNTTSRLHFYQQTSCMLI